MKQTHLNRLMSLIFIFGLLLIVSGLYLIIFTDIATAGVSGVLLASGLIAAGLFISVPIKLYLSFMLMKYNDEKLKRDNAKNEH